MDGIKQKIKFGIAMVRNLIYPARFKIIYHDWLLIKPKRDDYQTNTKYIDAAINWLCRAQDATGDGGVATYFFDKGWSTSYPEVTGYIIPTFFDYYHLTSHEEIRNRAIKMADFEVSIQMENGAFQGGYIGRGAKPTVFNTAQILQGLTRAYKETNDLKYYNAAKKSADWICAVQDDDGAWRQYVYLDIVRGYDTRVDLPLLEFYQINQEDKYRQAARKNIEWALTLQQENGWFKDCDNSPKRNFEPLTHTIGYTIEGLLESGILLNEQRYIEKATISADALLKRFEIDKSLKGRYNSDWKPTVTSCCLTGCAQMSIIWMRLFEKTKDFKYLNASLKMNDFLISTQVLNSSDKGIQGGIKGSHPIWGDYRIFSYPSWATKYFVDALILEDRIIKQLKEEILK
ncbi:MAG: pectate lyase [bacterium]